MTIAQRIQIVQDKISKVCQTVGRDPQEVSIVAVSKDVPSEKIQEAYFAGLRIFGESYLQEALEKIKQLQLPEIQWHYIGNFQENKARKVAQNFAMVQSLGSLRAGQRLNYIGFKINKIITCLLEVNIGREPQKAGFFPESLPEALPLFSLPYLKIEGLMTIPPRLQAEESRIYFRQLRELKDDFSIKNSLYLPCLSMGMSQDYPQAIEEGSTMVRIGRAIFGERRLR